MSLPKRPINVDPDTSLRDASDLIKDAEDEVKFRVGAHLYVVHRSDEAFSEADSESAQTDATSRLIANAGGWKDLVDAEALKRYLYEMRDSDRDRPAVDIQ